MRKLLLYIMRGFLFSLFLCFCIQGQAQLPGSCQPNSDLKTYICGNNNSDPNCPACKDCASYILVSDSSYKIISYRMIVSGEGFDDPEEIVVNDVTRSERLYKSIVARIRPGNLIEMYCIKAKHTNGAVVVLQPVSYTIKARNE